MTWLRDHEHELLEEQPGSQNGKTLLRFVPLYQSDVVIAESEPDWVLEHYLKERKNAVIQKKADLEARLARIRAKELRQKQHYDSGKPYQKRMASITFTLLSDVLIRGLRR